MAWYDKIIDTLGRTISKYMSDDLVTKAVHQREYFNGEHPEQLKVKPGQYNDNYSVNYIGLAIARSVSRLFNGGVEFKLPDDASQKYIDLVWDTNKEEQLLYQLGLNGGVYGTPFLKIMPDGIANRVTNVLVPRLIALDPEITNVFPDPFDVDTPTKYEIVFTVEETSYMERTSKIDPKDYESFWLVEHFIMYKGKRKWVPDPDQPPYIFEYNFPPIHHWKNLPALKASHGCHGSTDAEWAVGAQDKLNFADANINKTIRMNAAPPTIVTGTTQKPDMATGPGSLSWFSSELTKVYNLTANADIAGSRAFAGDLQSAIFQLMREVPPAVIAQLGSGLTNFVMRVVFSDAVDKTDTKREMYGDAILEVNRRLLVMNGMKPDPGTIEWQPALPQNPQEQMVEDEFLLRNALASKDTIQRKHGIDPDVEKPMLAKDAKEKKDKLGGDIMRFIAGKQTNE